MMFDLEVEEFGVEVGLGIGDGLVVGGGTEELIEEVEDAVALDDAEVFAGFVKPEAFDGGKEACVFVRRVFNGHGGSLDVGSRGRGQSTGDFVARIKSV